MDQHDSPRLLLTHDGSHTLYNAALNQHYHSLQGSLQESQHIFIGLGLLPKIHEGQGRQEVRVLEMGFGTGLNALLSWKIADQMAVCVAYTGIEAYPVSLEEAGVLNYGEKAGKQGFMQLHTVSWQETHRLSACFSFCKQQQRLEALQPEGLYDVIYFDAFAPEAQPELWTEAVFTQLAKQLPAGGILVTYSSKGAVRRALQASGFRVEKHPGPGRKREVIRAVKMEATPVAFAG